MSIEKIELAEFHARLKAQGVPTREDAALVCPVCSTVQSMRSLLAAGVPGDKVETQIGFSCEGRWTKAGPADRNGRSQAPNGRGCDWTLGGAGGSQRPIPGAERSRVRLDARRALHHSQARGPKGR